MVYGIGTDFLHLSRLKPLEGQWDDAFFRRTYTDAERQAALGRQYPLLYFADRFSAKEAIYKALGLPPELDRLREIEILNNDAGQPYVRLHGKIRQFAEEAGIKKVHISLSSDEDTAVAFALCEGD